MLPEAYWGEYLQTWNSKGILCDLPLLEWASDAILTLHRNKHVNLSNKRSEEAGILKVCAADGTDFIEWC